MEESNATSLWQNNCIRFFPRARDLANHRFWAPSIEPDVSSVLWMEQALNTIRKQLAILIGNVPLFPSGHILPGQLLL